MTERVRVVADKVTSKPGVVGDPVLQHGPHGYRHRLSHGSSSRHPLVRLILIDLSELAHSDRVFTVFTPGKASSKDVAV